MSFNRGILYYSKKEECEAPIRVAYSADTAALTRQANFLDSGRSVLLCEHRCGDMRRNEAARKGKDRRTAGQLDIFDVTREVAEKAGVYKKTIKSQSRELADGLIAAAAFINQATLVTGNINHHPMADVEKVTLL